MKGLLASSLFSVLFGKPRKMPWPAGLDLSEIRRILVVRDDHIGDLICSTPAFEALKKACPQAELTLVASTYNAEVVKDNPYIDRYVSMSRARKHEVERTLDVLKGIGIEHPLPMPLVVIDQPARDFATDIAEASSARPGSIKKRDSANASFRKRL